MSEQFELDATKLLMEGIAKKQTLEEVFARMCGMTREELEKNYLEPLREIERKRREAEKMPRPTPDYIPGELRDHIASLGYSGVTEYTEHIGLNRARLLKLFSGNQARLRPYFNFCQFAQISLDEMASLMETGKISTLILRLSEKHNCSINHLEKISNVGQGFLRLRMRGDGNMNGLQSYIEVAKALGWSLDKLAKVCLS